MRVLFINSVCGVGSTGRICTDLYDVFQENGHQCCIAYGRGDAPEQYNTYKIGGRINNYIHVLETRLFDNHGFSSRRATTNFIKFIENYNPDIINIHNIHGYFLNIEILCEYLSRTKAKIIWTLHDGWLFSGHAAHPKLDTNGEPIFKKGIQSQSREYPKSYVNREKRNYYKKKTALLKIPAIQFITPSNWLSETAKMTYLKKYSFEVINNGIDLNSFYPDAPSEISKKKIILGVSSFWNESKGLQIFNELVNLLDLDKYEIMLVGNIKEKVNKKIKIIDKTDSVDELRKIYSSATYFVNPTFNDTFPTVNIEALACGTPVITFKTGGSPEIITKETGIVVEEKTSQALRDMIVSEPKFDFQNCVDRAKKFDKKSKFAKYKQILL
ncbi:TPA: glycosyltransferase [Enterococcus faecium]|nr:MULTISPECIES: glycosyltransferase [Enterococcus]EEI59828.1 glycosyltransferase, group 1 family protein [Enterococcus faecium TX1330]EGP4835431.1 glycosyltransferase [Enterococcus faecium]EGP4852370.1 glycosyltransferase [Enterococcus faecium]EGP5068272.1 glycosyltransferase [Enterococcus faecium]MBE8861960.1 glycosyltransferase [Enterococcus faecium]